MKKWIQKFLIATVAVITLGVITPSHTIWNNLLESTANAKTDNRYDDAHPSTYIEAPIELTEPIEYDLSTIAKEQAYQKFGSRIGPKIQKDFDAYIFPKIQEAIDETVKNSGQMTNNHLAITENPSGNYSEKIFNIYDETTGEDLIRFHVRTENRPLEGYYYNFHYHKAEDGFTRHYNLGEVYWSKNTPPKWLS